MRKSSLLSDSDCRSYSRALKSAGAAVAFNEQAGTVIAKDGDAEVFRAIQTYQGGNWIATFKDGNNITWGHNKAA